MIGEARSWGATEAERVRTYPCDAHLADFEEELYRGIDVDAPPERLFRWLCQLRVAPYSHDWLDNFGRRSPRHLIDGLDRLERGQTFMFSFDLIDFEPPVHVTLLNRLTWLFGQIAATYLVERRASGSRLTVKLRVKYPRGPFFLMRWVLPSGDLFMMKKQLRTLEALAEETTRAPAT